MRNLTITRRKSYVGCIMKDQIYIRDEQARELMIDGVPCRKLGSIKNGETKTFPIGEEEQQIFLIVDKTSKDYCNATVTVPQGQEDVTLSGVHQFVFGSNPFRFDGVQPSAEQLAKQKKNGRRGAVITVAAVIIGFVAGYFLPKVLWGNQTNAPKTFTKEEFQITLTEAFEPTQAEGFFAFYQSKSVMVFTVREEKELFGDITLEEYGDLVQQANNKTQLAMNIEDDFLWFDYTDTPQQQELYYLSVCCESGDAFWIINFATPATNRTKYKETFLNWAETVEFEVPENGYAGDE